MLSWLTTVVVLCTGGITVPALALDNGFTRPALGWSSWYAAPHGSQVTDAFVRASAKALVSSGLAKKGYVYVNVTHYSPRVPPAAAVLASLTA